MPNKTTRENRNLNQSQRNNNKYNNKEENTNVPVEQQNIITCNDRRCPNGYRCNIDKICYKLKSLDLEFNRQTLSLIVDGNRGKTYDIDFLNTNFERISTLKNGRIDGKQITGKKLQEIVADLKKNITKNTKNTYYGTLNDEMIIQIIYLIVITFFLNLFSFVIFLVQAILKLSPFSARHTKIHITYT